MIWIYCCLLFFFAPAATAAEPTPGLGAGRLAIPGIAEPNRPSTVGVPIIVARWGAALITGAPRQQIPVVLYVLPENRGGGRQGELM